MFPFHLRSRCKLGPVQQVIRSARGWARSLPSSCRLSLFKCLTVSEVASSIGDMTLHKNDVLLVAAPCASMAEVERAGPAQLADSKRYWKIEKQESDLTGQLGELEEGTRQRNREFEAKLRAIEERIRGLEAGIAREVEEREETHAVMFTGLQEKLKEAAAAIEAEAEESITARFEPGLLENDERVEADDARVEEFVHVTVPRVFSEQSGAVMKKLQRARETFDIENAKIAKRERKLVSRFTDHVNGAAQSFEDERATRVGKLWLLGEDLEGVEHMDDRGDESLHLSIVRGIKATRGDVVAMSEERGYQDGLLLDSLTHAQQRLQRCILETFGAKDEDCDVDPRRGARVE